MGRKLLDNKSKASFTASHLEPLTVMPVLRPAVSLSYSTANNFLVTLAHENGGRFHRCHANFDAQLFAHTLLTEGFTDHEVCSLYLLSCLP